MTLSLPNIEPTGRWITSFFVSKIKKHFEEDHQLNYVHSVLDAKRHIYHQVVKLNDSLYTETKDGELVFNTWWVDDKENTFSLEFDC